jgi:hypothetical protein
MKNELDDKKFLGKKKIRLENLSSMNKKEDDEDSDEELEKYRKITTGKLNLKSILENKNKNFNDSKESEKKNLKNEKFKVSDKTSSLSAKLLNLLPNPKKELKDKFCFKPDGDFLNQISKYSKLINPDSNDFIDETQSEQHRSFIINQSNKVVDVNVEDQVDGNWSLKYLSHLQKEVKEEYHPPEEQKNKTQLSNLISDYNKTLEQNYTEVSKYSKLSTRQKYGW